MDTSPSESKHRPIALRRWVAGVSLLVDILLINGLILLFWLDDARVVLGSIYPILFPLSAIVWLFLSWLFKVQPLDRIPARWKNLRNLSGAVFSFISIILLSHIAIHKHITLSLTFLYYCLILLAALQLWHLVVEWGVRNLRKKGYDSAYLLIAGKDELAEKLAHFILTNPWTGYRFSGYLDPAEVNARSGITENRSEMLHQGRVDILVINLPRIDQSLRDRLHEIALNQHIELILLPDLEGFLSYAHHYQRFDLNPLISIGRSPLSLPVNRFIKRLFDLLGSLFLLLFFFSWISILMAIWIRSGSKGPVFFRQKRTGYQNKDFTIWKFRTMHLNAEADIRQAEKEDERLTRMGRFLRRHNLDELPQLLNVVAGQMSLVGPRPHMLAHTQQYAGQVAHYLYRHYTKPGMTGLAQVRGLRGEMRKLEDMESRIAQDVYYLEHWTLWLDIKIIWITLLQTLQGHPPLPQHSLKKPVSGG
jgi:putative colanic acid biosynthesis UDP-glucose lipid carrier transferase